MKKSAEGRALGRSVNVGILAENILAGSIDESSLLHGGGGIKWPNRGKGNVACNDSGVFSWKIRWKKIGRED